MEKQEKKQIPLRLSKRLCDELSQWAEDDFRSLNGQIEYILTEAVAARRKKKRKSASVPSETEPE